MMSKHPEAVLAELDAYIDEHRYARHSFVATIQSGDYQLSDLRAWAVQKYFQTREQNCVHSAVHYNARPHLDIRQYQVRQLVDEETADGEGGGPHYLLIKRLADELGARPEDFADERCSPAVERFVDYLLRLCHDEHPVIGMMGSYINERQTPESAGKMYRALKERHGFSDEVLEWFIVHSEADIEHAGEARSLILRYAHEVPDFEARARRTVENGIVEWRALQDYYVSVLLGGRSPAEPAPVAATSH
jgi:pyrroloquinoline-quinone synthase